MEKFNGRLRNTYLQGSHYLFLSKHYMTTLYMRKISWKHHVERKPRKKRLVAKTNTREATGNKHLKLKWKSGNK